MNRTKRVQLQAETSAVHVTHQRSHMTSVTRFFKIPDFVAIDNQAFSSLPGLTGMPFWHIGSVDCTCPHSHSILCATGDPVQSLPPVVWMNSSKAPSLRQGKASGGRNGLRSNRAGDGREPCTALRRIGLHAGSGFAKSAGCVRHRRWIERNGFAGCVEIVARSRSERASGLCGNCEF